jgi:hypothetical protein
MSTSGKRFRDGDFGCTALSPTKKRARGHTDSRRSSKADESAAEKVFGSFSERLHPKLAISPVRAKARRRGRPRKSAAQFKEIASECLLSTEPSSSTVVCTKSLLSLFNSIAAETFVDVKPLLADLGAFLLALLAWNPQAILTYPVGCDMCRPPFVHGVSVVEKYRSQFNKKI